MRGLSTDIIKVELGKIKGYAEGLKKEVSSEQLDRLAQRRILVEVKLSFEKIQYYFLKDLETLPERLKPVASLPTFKPAIINYFASLVSSVESTMHYLDTPSYYKDEDVRRNTTNLIFALESFVVTISDALSLPLTGIVQIAELVSTGLMGLDENWATANCYLGAMEISVNRKLNELGIQTEEKEFSVRFRELLKVLEDKGTSVSELEKELPHAFWKLRHRVVHSGYSPTRDELELIVAWVKKVIALCQSQ